MTSPEATVDPHTAALALTTAVDQLVAPNTRRLQRDIPVEGTDAFDQAVVDARRAVALRATLHEAHRAGDTPAARAALKDLGRIHCRTRTDATTPSLLDQLQAEIPASTGGHGAPTTGSSHSPLALAALDIVTEIERRVGGTRGPRLCAQVRDWADRWVTAADDTTYGPGLAERADTAQRWVDTGWTILDPPRRWTLPGRCPDCANRTAWVPDDTGERVQRPAIELDPATETARCLRCRARWTGPAQLGQLEKVLRDQEEPGALLRASAERMGRVLVDEEADDGEADETSVGREHLFDDLRRTEGG